LRQAFSNLLSNALKYGPEGMAVIVEAQEKPPLVRRIADLHGGRAWVEDDPEGGCAFCFEFPCAPGRPGDPGYCGSSSSPRPK